MKSNQNKKTRRINYGQEMTGFMIISLILAVVLTITAIWRGIIYSMTRETTDLWLILICAIFSFAGIAFFTAGRWSSRVGKLRMRDKLIDMLPLNGNEQILDVGCGRGLLLTAAAKRLTTGIATGIDHWKGTAEYKNNSEMARANALLEGVSDKVTIVDGDATSLPFSDNQFDVVTTSLMMHHVHDSDIALKEMVRVLKGNGIIVIADVAAGRFINPLEKMGMTVVKSVFAVRLFFMPVRIVVAKKNLITR